MAYVKSTSLTQLDANDGLLNDEVIHGKLMNISDVYEASGALADNTVIGFFAIPVNAKIKSIVFAADDLGTTGDINIGFYPGNIDIADDSDAVDEDAIAQALDVNASATSRTEIRYSVHGIETVNEKAWELAGLSAAPDYSHFIIAATLSEATTAGGTIVLDVDYVN